ncbi:MAG: ATP12 family chaperone protein [Pseudomonadota bacterium]
MTGWVPKRFWTEARALPVAGGFGVSLDDRPLRTPGRAPLVVPALPLAEAIAAEWAAQGERGERVDPQSMPFTRTANTAIDTVRPNFAQVAATVSAYGGTDLLCYRAEAPRELVARQAEAWDPLLDWAARAHSARLAAGTGILHIPQDPQALAGLSHAVGALTPFALAALHELVALSGSLVIGLAALKGAWPGESLWAASRIDEDWQAGLWGTDEEAAANAARRKTDFLSAQVFHRLAALD